MSEIPYYMDRCKDTDLPTSTGQAKASKIAISFLVMVLFLAYVTLVVLTYVLPYIPKFAWIGKIARKVMNEIAYKHAFFFMLLALYHVVLPKAFPVIVLYFYVIPFAAYIAMFFVKIPHQHLIQICIYGVS